MHKALTPLLPNDVDTLKEFVLNQLELNRVLEEKNKHHLEEQETLKKETLHYKTQVLSLQEQLNILLRKRFGPSSEKISPDQIRLFNEAELETDAGDTHAATDTEVDANADITELEHRRKKRGRKPLPKDLPRVEVIARSTRQREDLSP